MKVPKELIDEATRRGIVPGAKIRDDQMRVGTVPPIEEWSEGAFGSLFLNHTNDLRAFNANTDKWATVITPAPSAQPEPIGLQEGDAVECSPAMCAAIIELAKELGVPTYGVPPDEVDIIGFNVEDFGRGLGLCTVGFCAMNKHTPEVFIAKMRVTASQPKPITIGDHTVKFTKGEIKVGCATIPNETVRAIAAKMID